MFLVAERTRRRWCRRAFLALCLLPTALVLALVLGLRSERYRQYRVRQLADTLGLKAQCSRVCHPRPGQIRWENLRLEQPESGQLVASFPQLDGWFDPQGLLLRAASAEFQGSQWVEAERLLQSSLTGRGPRPPRRCQMLVAAARIHTLAEPLTLGPIDLRWEQAAAGPAWQLACELARGDQVARCRIRATRDRNQTPAVTTVELRTDQSPWPIALLGMPWQSHLSLGHQSEFTGQMRLVQGSTGWTADVAGRLSQVQLEPLVAGRLPHQLSGTAEVRIDRAQIADGRLVYWAGAVTAGPGQVSRGLLDAWMTSLGTAQARRLSESSARVVEFERLEMAVVLDAAGVSLRGSPAERGAILIDRQGPLVREPQGTQPLAALVRALAPAAGLTLPATREADQLARWLPWSAPDAGQPMASRPLVRQPGQVDAPR